MVVTSAWIPATRNRGDRGGGIQKCWDKVDWPSQLDQAQRNVLAFEHKDIKFSIPRSKKSKVPEIAHVSMEEVGRNLIRCVDGVAHPARFHKTGTPAGGKSDVG